MTETVQQQADRIAFDMFVDMNLDASAAAYQLGTTTRTVKARVRRHSLRLSAQREVSR